MNLYNEIKKHFPKMAIFLSLKSLKEFLECDYEHLCFYHFGCGTWIRNELLQENQPLYDAFLSCGISQKDDMSFLMIQLFYVYLKPKYNQKFYGKK